MERKMGTDTFKMGTDTFFEENNDQKRCLSPFSNKTIAIIGAQRSGQAAAKLVVQKKGKARITEKGLADSVSENFHQWAATNDVALEWGGHTRAFVQDSDCVVVSPGVRMDAQPIQWARAKGIPVIGEIELAARFCDKPIIAVTGSNGKTTVTTLIHQVLQAAGYSTCLCGNIGQPFAEYVLNLEDKDYVVLEVSSFQMETIKHFHPYVALFLNFSRNHLDRHKDMEEYFAAKKRIFENQTENDFAILNNNYEEIRHLAHELGSKVFYFNGDARSENEAAVLAAAQALRVDTAIAEEVFQNFKGIEHRLEWVRNVHGVEFINDSKATTVEAGRWALQRQSSPVIMICGGKDKNSDFSTLKNMVQEKVKAMFLIGEARGKMKNAFKDVVHIEEYDQLQDAVERAQQYAEVGDTILFSPMCASFDMFENFEERGMVFKEIVFEK